jgi:hypothetical protein
MKLQLAQPGLCRMWDLRRGEEVVATLRIPLIGAALAEADEVLVSSTVKDLVIGSHVAFADRGSHELKGVPGARSLFVVDAGSAA